MGKKIKIAFAIIALMLINIGGYYGVKAFDRGTEKLLEKFHLGTLGWLDLAIPLSIILTVLLFIGLFIGIYWKKIF